MGITDVNGRAVVEMQNYGTMSLGSHRFRISLRSAGTYILTVRQNGKTTSVKMVNTGHAAEDRIYNVDNEAGTAQVQLRSTTSHDFVPGDEMCYTGYTQHNGSLTPSTPVTQLQGGSEVISLAFNLEYAELPIVATVMASDITANSAVSGGNVFSDGGASVTARGVCWSVETAPTIAESHTNDGTGTGAFTSNLTNLMENTTYYVRAYATNSAGTAYGQEVTFTTLHIEPPTVESVETTEITANTAVSGGLVVDDGGAPVTARGVCWSVMPSPTIAESHTTDGTGTGAFTSNLTNLVENTTYYVRSYATNRAGTSYGEETSFVTIMGSVVGHPCPGTPTITDYDGNLYNTVLIGDQCWMRENLRTTHYANGTPITEANPEEEYQAYYASNHIPCRYIPNNNSITVPLYGYLYNWPTAMHGAERSDANPSGVQGICPNGWHLPSDAEWTALTDYVNLFGEYQCNGLNTIAKSLASTSGWINSSSTCAPGNNQSLNNATEFNAMPAGIDGSTYGYMAGFHSASASFRSITCNESTVNVQRPSNNYSGIMSVSASIRCVKDLENVPSLPEVITISVIDGTSEAACRGEVNSDGGSTVTGRGFCWSTSEAPTIADSHITEGSGLGLFTTDITTLEPGTRYYVRAYATNSMGTAYGTTIAVTIHRPCPNTPTVTDIDGNSYRTIKIGHQCWMKEDLRATHYANGDTIIMGNIAINNFHLEESPIEYGYHYSITAILHGAESSDANPSGIQGVCPDGWHVPSHSEWMELLDTIRHRDDCLCDGNTANIAKALSSTYGWSISTGSCTVGNNQGYNNASGFSAIPSSFWGTISEIGEDVGFPSTSNSSEYGYTLRWGNTSSDTEWPVYTGSCPVRCVREADSVITAPASSITAMSAVCGGKVASIANCNTMTARGVCWSTAHNPTIADNHTIDGTGAGWFTSFIEGLADSTIYYVRAYVTNDIGTFYGNEISFTTLPSPRDGQPCAINFVDYDGNSYNTVQIGRQCWMKENLRTKHYANGTILTRMTSTSTSYSSVPAYYSYDYEEDNNSVFYNQVCVGSSSANLNPSGVQGICPTGWHVPSKAEWEQLTSYLKSNSEYWCGNSYSSVSKSLASQSGWSSSTVTCSVGNDLSLNNATGFSASPTGRYNASSASANAALYWTTSQTTASPGPRYLYIFSIGHDSPTPSFYTGQQYHTYNCAFAVRCLRDLPTDIPTITTIPVTEITPLTALSGGIIHFDGNAAITERGICWSTSHNPTINDSHTESGADTGAFYSTISNFAINTTYYVRAYATNCIGTAYGNEVVFSTTNPNPYHCGTYTLTDRDGNRYNTVQIGNQCWMKENLRTTRYADGTAITLGSSYNDHTTPYRLIPQGRPETILTDGYYYNWSAIIHGNTSSNTNPSGVQGICPDGWHVPSDAEWSQLIDHVSLQNQYVCGSDNTYIGKSLASTTGWNSSTATCAVGNDITSNNATGFSALPSGYFRRDYGGYYAYGANTRFWSSTEDIAYILSSNSALLDKDSCSYCTGFWFNSVRCVRDCHLSVSIIGDTVLCEGNDAVLTATGADNYSWSTGETTSTIPVTEAGTYSVTGTDVEGCASSSSINISVFGVENTKETVVANNSYTWHGQTYMFANGSEIFDNHDVILSEDFSSVTGSGTQQCEASSDAITNTLDQLLPGWTGEYIYPSNGKLKLGTSNSIGWIQTPTMDFRNYDSVRVSFQARSWNGANEYPMIVYVNDNEFIIDNLPNTQSTIEIDCSLAPFEITADAGDNITIRFEGHNRIFIDDVIIYGIHSSLPAIIVDDSLVHHGVYTFAHDDNRCAMEQVDTLYLTLYKTDNFACPRTPRLYDVDGNIYNTVQIGNQCWMRENLKTTRYANGTVIPQGSTSSTTDAYWYYPGGSSSNKQKFGLLYNWRAAMHNETSGGTVQGICPDGWHLPSLYEWQRLSNTVGQQSAYVCGSSTENVAKALASNTDWNSDATECAIGNDQSSNNATGFAALPAGGFTNGSTSNMGYQCFFGSSTSVSTSQGTGYIPFYITYNDATTHVYNYSYCTCDFGSSVRCVREISDTMAYVPDVNTDSVYSVTTNSATCGGMVYSDGGASVTARGVCWSTSPHPTIFDSHTTDGTGMGSFTSMLTGLTPGTTYYVRTYATNSAGTAYGEEVSFRTLGLPTVTTSSVSQMTLNTAICGGHVTSDGGIPITAQGVCWNTTGMPTIADNHTSENLVMDSNGYVNFTSTLMDLATATTYYVRAYAANDAGTAYGNEVSFRTLSVISANGYATGFEASEGFSAGTAYNNITAVYAGPSGQQWGTFRGTTSTTVPISGSQSMQMRWYTNAPDVMGCTFTNFLLSDLRYITFMASSTNGLNVEVSYSIDEGNTFSHAQLFTLSYTAQAFDYAIDESDYSNLIQLKFTMVLPETAPTATSRLLIDNVVANGTTEVNTSCPHSVTDVDGNVYNTVQIGSQCWMKENLRTTRYADETEIPVGSTTSYTEPYRYAPNYDDSIVPFYGYLYNWAAVMHGAASSDDNPSGVQGICPDGWHVPSDAEWTQLTDYVSRQSENVCIDTIGGSYIAKALASNTGWNNYSYSTCAVGYNRSSNNATGFGALPAGYYYSSGCYGFGDYAYFWSATEDNGSYSYYRNLYYGDGMVVRYLNDKSRGYSVRCLRDQ